MKKILLIMAILALVAGCSSAPVKEQSNAVQPKVVVAPSSPAQPASKIEPRVSTPPAEKQRVVIDPLNDPNGPLAKRSVYYEFDRSDIKDEYKSLIQAHAGYLIGHRAAKVRVEGNCDERGSREYNLALGQRRADSVKAAMKLLGAMEGQIDTVSWGEEKPRAAGHDEAAWSENRRSDIIYQTAR